MLAVCRVFVGLVCAAVLWFGTWPAALAQSAPPCKFELGFATIRQMIPTVVGNCLENEGHNPANGDGLQQTTGGLLVWRKADNWTAFTDGYRTWINGPYGLQERLNTQRFVWEAQETPPTVAKTLLDVRGSGEVKTAVFNPTNGWNLDWSYDCRQAGGGALFSVFSFAPGNETASGSLGTQSQPSGQGTAHFTQGGPQFLNIIAYNGCTWHVTVRG